MGKRIGTTLIIISTVASINPYLIFFTIPIYLLGVVLIFCTNLKLKHKIYWAIVPALSLMLFFSLVSEANKKIQSIERNKQIINSLSNVKRVRIQLPKGFRGRVAIITNVCNGRPFLRNKNELGIPKNGILICEGGFDFLATKFKYYQQDSSDVEINIPLATEDTISNIPKIFGKSFGNTIYEKINGQNTLIKYDAFIVSDKSQLANTENKSDFEKRIIEKVKELKEHKHTH